MARFRFSTTAERASALFSCGALLFGIASCEKLIGIEDTTVNEGGAAGDSTSAHGGSPGAGSGSAGAPGSGAHSAGSTAQGGDDEAAGSPSTDQGGNANGGSSTGNGGTSNGGTSNGGTSNGGTSNGGTSNGGASAGKGGIANGGASAGTAGTAQCDCKAPTPICEAGKCIARGPVEIKAGSMAGGTSFYVDSTEVTNQQYAAFLQAKGSDTSGQRADCVWNKSYQPAAALGDDTLPAVNVDFCDAAAFCDWAGERLCGNLSGGPIAEASMTDPSQSQWYLACAGQDSDLYPYGNDVKADYCNEYFSGGDLAEVGKFSNCNGHYKGVFDLVGNAAEWVDSCVTTAGNDRSLDMCQLMGGNYLKETYRCSSSFEWARNGVADSFGFRCCSK